MKKPFHKVSKIFSILGFAVVHFQILIGIILYFLSPIGKNNFSGESMKHSISRFYIIEHPLGMILAAILITIGYRKAKNPTLSDAKRHVNILLFYGISLAIISYLIPWVLWN